MRRLGCWIAYYVVAWWPLSVERRGIGRVYWALLPHAGSYAHYWSEPLEYRRQMDQLRE